MCGLVGIAGKLDTKDEDVMKRLFCHDYWRGKDSTGLAAIRGTDSSVHLAKIASHPLDLFDTQRFKTALNGWTSKVFLGHNRASTRGATNAVNAHPFQFDHIVGAHNGTLTHQSHSALEDAIGEKYNVDSQALIHAIAKLGIKETISLCDGAWALTWVDLEENTLNFLRNKERPLWYAYSKNHDKVYWASEYWMIQAACGVNNIELADLVEGDKVYKFYATEVDIHYKWDLAKLKAGGDRPKPKAKEIKGKEVPVKANRQDPFGRAAQSALTLCSTDATTTSTTNYHGTKKIGKHLSTLHINKEDKVDNRHVHFVGDKKKPFAGLISREEFEDIAKYGCSHCEAAIDWDDVGLTIFLRDQIVLCPDCSCKDEKKANRIYVPDLQPYIQ